MKNIVWKYSEKEIKLIEYYEFGYLIDNPSMPPPTLYRTLAEKAFVDNDKSIYADSLRRIMQAWLWQATVYRGTDAFEDLIQV